MLAVAGGISPTGNDQVVVSGMRDGKPYRKAIDVPSLFRPEGSADDILLAPGDTVYVTKAPTFYIYGAAQRPGTYKIERGMTMQQALAVAGGPNARGSERMRLDRKAPDGRVQQVEPRMTDVVEPGDVLFVKESLF
jgi:polysaccharide export outer membrane protein